MSVSIDVSLAGARAPLGCEAIASVARGVLRREGVRSALLSIALVDRAAIARINRRHLGHPGPTDVISFAFARATPRDPIVGDIYIAPDVARANARAGGVPVRNEITRLVVHGVLHILGYDHPLGEGRERSPMWRRQERLVRAFEARAPRR
ncbi:MAG: rRNA maturation RNase YbeY [Gemmatimonadales bacterium]